MINAKKKRKKRTNTFDRIDTHTDECSQKRFFFVFSVKVFRSRSIHTTKPIPCSTYSMGKLVLKIPQKRALLHTTDRLYALEESLWNLGVTKFDLSSFWWRRISLFKLSLLGNTWATYWVSYEICVLLWYDSTHSKIRVSPFQKSSNKMLASKCDQRLFNTDFCVARNAVWVTNATCTHW